MRLDAQTEGDVTADQPLTLRNLGPDAVTILSVRVDREGYDSTPTDLLLEPSVSGQVPLPFTGACPQGVPRTSPSGVLVAVRTARGGQKVVRVDISDTDASFAFVDRIKRSCGLFESFESIEVVSSTVALVGREVRVHLDVTNRSRLRRDLSALSLAPGFGISTSPRLPLVVPPRTTEPGEPLAFDARVTVTDCATARRAIEADPATSEQPFDGVQSEINGSSSEGPAFLFLGEEFSGALLDLVAASC